MCGKSHRFRTRDVGQLLDLSALPVEGGGKSRLRFAATHWFCRHLIWSGWVLLSHAKAHRYEAISHQPSADGYQLTTDN
jgi:hypothetical protein